MSAGHVGEQTAVRPFQVGFPEAELIDLRRRINATRWPERETVTDDSQGVPLATHAGARALLGDRLRLARVRGEAQRPAELHHRDRRARHPLHPRPLPARGRAAADRHARVARLDHRAAEDHRAAHEPDGPRRERRGRVPSGDPVAAGPRVLGQADRDRVGSRPHRAGLGGADEAPRLRPVRRAGRRLGRGRHPGDGHPGGAGAARHPLEHARHRAGRDRRRRPARRPAAGRPVRRGATRLRPAERVLRQARRLRADHVDAPADHVRARGLADRSRRVRDRPRRRHRPARPRSHGSSRDACRATSPATTSSTTSRSTG